MKQNKTEFPLTETDREALTRCKQRGEELMSQLSTAQTNLRDTLEKQIAATRQADEIESRVADTPEDLDSIREMRTLRDQAALFGKKVTRLELEIEALRENFRALWIDTDDALRAAAKPMLPILLTRITDALVPFCRTRQEAQSAAEMTAAVTDLQHYATWRANRVIDLSISAEKATERVPAQLEKIIRILDGAAAWEFNPAA